MNKLLNISINIRHHKTRLNLEGDNIETRARVFAHKAVNDSIWAFDCILTFIQFQKERFYHKEITAGITAGTIRNYVKNCTN